MIHLQWCVCMYVSVLQLYCTYCDCKVQRDQKHQASFTHLLHIFNLLSCASSYSGQLSHLSSMASNLDERTRIWTSAAQWAINARASGLLLASPRSVAPFIGISIDWLRDWALSLREFPMLHHETRRVVQEVVLSLGHPGRLAELVPQVRAMHRS